MRKSISTPGGFDLDKIEQPEGWSGEAIGKPEDDEEDEDEDWDDDEDEDEDEDDLDEETDGNY
jgi:hypothetical protein